MIPFGAIRQGDLTVFLVLLGVLVLCLAFLTWQRWRARRDPDRGGAGYTPLAGMTAVDVPLPAEPADPVDTWLQGFAAPYAVGAGLDPGAWDLGVAARPIASAASAGVRESAADAVAAAARVSGADSPDGWRTAVSEATTRLARAPSSAERVRAVSALAWVHRLGVAQGFQSADAAKAATRAAAGRLDPAVSDWLAYGDLFGQGDPAVPGTPVASARLLYRPGAPWALDWPRER